MARHEDTQDVGWRLFCLCKMCEAKGQLLSIKSCDLMSEIEWELPLLNPYFWIHAHLKKVRVAGGLRWVSTAIFIFGWLVEVERKHVGEHNPLTTSNSLTFRQTITITLHLHYNSCDDHLSSTEWIDFELPEPNPRLILLFDKISLKHLPTHLESSGSE